MTAGPRVPSQHPHRSQAQCPAHPLKIGTQTAHDLPQDAAAAPAHKLQHDDDQGAATKAVENTETSMYMSYSSFLQESNVQERSGRA